MKLNVDELAPGMSLKVAPPSVLDCHCTVGTGLPAAAAVNVAVSPAMTAESTGLSVTTGTVAAGGETMMVTVSIEVAPTLSVTVSRITKSPVTSATNSGAVVVAFWSDALLPGGIDVNS